ncbi:hypothetical protein Pcinc_017789 [Petrolisthes cinctipes]|uniref:Uncharacterized protein n=1 Tax=Petrolisthes cinctipes TaxID=88211 RepID=A0AAE1FQR2_PETCI|nr:hypothetical protein Pcinc_017789 [Petrolisthes cinctipes]
MEVLSSCVGEVTVRRWRQQVKVASNKCEAVTQHDTQLIADLHFSYALKRHTETEEDNKVKALRDKMTTTLSNITCVLREMKMVTSENEPNYPYLTQEIATLPVTETLKKELTEAVQACRDFSRCLPMEEEEVVACMRADLRKKYNSLHVGLLGGGGDLTTTDDLLGVLQLQLPPLSLHPLQPLATQVENLFLFPQPDPYALL